jgi:hypothetical protein
MNLERLVSVIAMEGELVPEQRLIALLGCCDAFEGAFVTHRCLVLEQQLVVLLEGCEAFELELVEWELVIPRCFPLASDPGVFVLLLQLPGFFDQRDGRAWFSCNLFSHRPLRRRCLVRGVLCWRYLPTFDQMLAMTGRKRWFLC